MRTFAQKQNQPEPESSTELAKSNESTPAADQAPHPLLDMQHGIGNQAVLRWLTTQPKPAVNTPDDIYERDADRIAGQALATPAHSVVSDNVPHIQRSPAQSNGQKDSVPASVQQTVASSGQPLEPAVREDMERRFGHDFDHVRIHTGSQASDSARSVYARAYTVGSHIAFGADEFAPGTEKGSKLLAHELAHTIQQCESDGALPASPVRLACAPAPIDAYTDDMLEKRLTEVGQRLKEKSYPDRDRDVDLHMALSREAEKRARAAAVIAAQSFLESTEPKEEPYKVPARFRPGGFTDEDIDPGAKERKIAEEKRIEQEALARKLEEQGRPARLNLARRYINLHGLSRHSAADVLTFFLTVNDLRVLRKNGLEPPGALTTHYGDKVIAVIDKLVPRNPIEDREDTENLQRRAAAIENVAGRIEGLTTEGPHALAGRVVGGTTAYIAGKDPLAGSEIGAAFGGMFGARREMRYGTRSITSSTEGPTQPRSVIEEPAPIRENIPPPSRTEPPSPAKPNITFPRGTDVTKGGPFPAPGAQPSTAGSGRETVADFQKRGGNITKVPEGQSGLPKSRKPGTTEPTAWPTGPRSASDADVLSQQGMRRQDRAYPSTPQHHVFPQELEAWFKERFKGTKENIHEYTLYISEGEHQAIHTSGKGSVVKGVKEPDLKGWNQEWKDFTRDYPTASPQAIFEKAGQLMDKYKISAAEITRYKRARK